MAIQEAPKPTGSQPTEMGAFPQKLPRDIILRNNRLLELQMISSPIFRDAMRTGSPHQITPKLTDPFEFEVRSEIMNYTIVFKLEVPDRSKPQEKKFTATKVFSFSGPSRDIDGNELEDKGPFDKTEVSFSYGENPHTSYSWSISDDSRPPIKHDDTQEAFDRSAKFIRFLPFS